MSKKYGIPSLAILALAVAWLSLTASPAGAVKQFRDQFKSKYIKSESKDPKDVALLAAFDEARCSVCHVGDNKKNRNAYGKAVGQFVHKPDAKNSAKIQAALEKAAAVKSNPSDPKSPTFGEIIAKGKLPAAP